MAAQYPPVSVSRRDLLKLSAATGLAALVPGSIGCRPAQAAAHPGVYVNLQGPPGYPQTVAATTPAEVYNIFKLVATDLRTMNSREMPVPFPAHSLLTSPEVPNVVVLCEKWGPHVASYDYASMTELARLSFDPTRECIGHCAFAPGGQSVYVSEALMERGSANYAEGRIAVRDPRTLELQREFPSYGENPHEIQLIEGGRTLVICNQGTQRRPVETFANLAYVDTATGELIERLDFPSPEYAPAHMRCLPNGDVLMITKVQDFHNNHMGNTVYTRFGREPLRPIELPEPYTSQFVGEILSIDIDVARGRICTTCPDSSNVIFWDYLARSVLRVDTLARPLGVALTLDGRYWLVNDIEGGTHVWDAETLEPAPDHFPPTLTAAVYTAPHAHIARIS